MKDFKGRTALITGASNGFGKEFVIQAAKRGMNIVAVDIEDNFAELEKLAKENGAADITCILSDVGLYEETQKVVKTALDKYGTVELLINNAGIAVMGDMFSLPVQDLQWQMDTNVNAHFYYMSQLLPVMRDSGNDCHILNVCSMAGLIATRGMPAYYTSKHAAVTLAECTLYEIQARGITNINVSVFCPGFIQTTLHHGNDRRPERYAMGDDPYYKSDAHKESLANIEKEIVNGLEIDFVGDYVFKGIEDNQFYILTHQFQHPLHVMQAQDRVGNNNPSLKRLAEKAGELAAAAQKK